MSHIYIYDGPFEKGEKGWDLIRSVGRLYAEEKGLSLDVFCSQICREEKGKPHFTDIPLEFSLSHSGQLWMCMIDESPCGLDLQQVKACSFEEIAERFFSAEEQHYTALWGLEGFFDIWVRKEAFCKCTGQGFFSEMPSVVNADSDLRKTVIWKDRDYFFTEIPIAPDLKCAACTLNETIIEMRLLG